MKNEESKSNTRPLPKIEVIDQELVKKDRVCLLF